MKKLAPPHQESHLPLKGKDLLFVLAGQSNMSGRGYDPPSKLSSANPNSFRFSAHGIWERLDDSTFVHGDIDTNKRVGLGPAKAFANAVLEKTQANSVLLVPCAIGGTSLEEWSPQKSCFKLPSSGSLSPSSTTPSASSPSSVPPGGPSLDDLLGVSLDYIYESMLVRTRLAMRSFSKTIGAQRKIKTTGKSVLAGILWYQGENEAVTTAEHAHSYSSLFGPVHASFCQIVARRRSITFHSSFVFFSTLAQKNKRGC